LNIYVYPTIKTSEDKIKILGFIAFRHLDDVLFYLVTIMFNECGTNVNLQKEEKKVKIIITS